MKTTLCLKMLLREIKGSTTYNEFNDLVYCSIHSDEIACALKSNALDSPFLVLQGNSQPLRRSITRLLVRCSAALFPPILQLGVGAGELNSLLFNHWKDSAAEILPLTQ